MKTEIEPASGCYEDEDARRDRLQAALERDWERCRRGVLWSEWLVALALLSALALAGCLIY